MFLIMMATLCANIYLDAEYFRRTFELVDNDEVHSYEVVVTSINGRHLNLFF